MISSQITAPSSKVFFTNISRSLPQSFIQKASQSSDAAHYFWCWKKLLLCKLDYGINITRETKNFMIWNECWRVERGERNMKSSIIPECLERNESSWKAKFWIESSCSLCCGQHKFHFLLCSITNQRFEWDLNWNSLFLGCFGNFSLNKVISGALGRRKILIYIKAARGDIRSNVLCLVDINKLYVL